MAEYISREAVLKAFKLIAKNPNKDYQRGMQDAIDCLVPEVIADIPTVDVQPIKHGRWVETGSCYFKKCSECDSLWDISITNNIFTKYCPRCGAKMIKDGEQNDR
jgi:uncharacterized paraquat-inducible protein A